MVEIITYPHLGALEDMAQDTPEFMRPHTSPFAVEVRGHLSDQQCDAIIDKIGESESFSFNGCGALTREVHEDPTLDPIEQAARYINWMYWDYDLDPGQHSWMQTYEENMDYKRHFDGHPGQTRKLTAVAFLSDPETYSGGHLQLFYLPKQYMIPRTRGTIVVFQPWIEHQVTKVQRGVRQTINMGFWGPPFR